MTMTKQQTKEKARTNKELELDEAIIDLAKRAKLQGWNEFVEELKVPSELVPALMTNRPEMVRLAQRRPLSAEEADALYNLIAGLLETNSALREHANQVGIMVREWVGAIFGTHNIARKISRFAQFRHSEIDHEEDDAEDI